MIIKYHWLLILYFSLAHFAHAMAPPIVLEKDQVYPIGPYVDVLEDRDGSLTIEQVKTAPWQHRFTTNTTESINFGMTNSTYWFRFSVQNNAAESRHLSLDTKRSGIDLLDVFISRSSEWEHWRTGDSIPFQQRPIKYRDFVFHFVLEAAETRTVYIRMQAPRDGVRLPAELIDTSQFLLNRHNYEQISTLIYGVVIAMMLYNLLLFIVIKDSAPLYYACFGLSVLLAEITYRGYGFQYLWPNWPWLNEFSVTLSAYLICSSILMLTKQFLELTQHSKRLNQILKVLTAFSVLNMILVFFIPPVASTYLVTATLLVVFPTVLFTSFYIWLKGVHAARYLSLAWSTIIIPFPIASLSIIGVIPESSWTTISLYFGLLILFISLSLGLTIRINIFRQEKIAEQEQHLKLQKSYSAQLETANETLQEMSSELHRRANYDALTALPNRHLLLDRLKHEVLNAQRDESCLALMFLDLDRFKIINDNLGHHIGDQLLVEVANRLQEALRQNDTISRLGGDEFVVMLHNIKQPDYAALAAKKIANALQQPFIIQGHTLHISTSIGIAICPQDGTDVETLMKRADASMYQSKQRGVGSYSFYEESLENESQKKLSLETRLRQALEDDALELVFQPQHNARTHKISGVEALIRWHDDELGTIPPSQFIPIAEEAGFISELDWWVIKRTCHQIEEFQAKQLNGLKISINISPCHFMQANFAEQVLDIIDSHQIPRHLLEFEITEETFLGDAEQIQNVLIELREAGISIAIDDFGTGYSSLSYLRSFAVDTLKLDGCFIRDLETNKASRGIVAASILLGQNLGLKVVAECVENQEQLDFLAKHQCDVIQGYFFSKPLSTVELAEYKPFLKHSDNVLHLSPATKQHDEDVMMDNNLALLS
ncbi:MAG: EAL domain-containing protein [Pseudomonadota bacterium]